MEVGETVPQVTNSEINKSPNKIFELMSFSKDLKTQSDKVYRSVMGDGAIKDLFQCHFVRNKQAALGGESYRWGNAVYWSRGGEGKYHPVQQGGYVIETSFSTANERQVREEDITAIYRKNESGEVSNILEDLKQKHTNTQESLESTQIAADAAEIEKIEQKINALTTSEGQ
jgi:hypothetical protein